MGRVWKLSRCVAGGLLCAAGIARADEPPLAPPLPAVVASAPLPPVPPVPPAPPAGAALPSIIPPEMLPAVPPLPGAQPKGPPRDTTNQPIDRLLDPANPAKPGVQAAATQAAYTFFPTLGFAGQSGVLPRSGGNDEYDTLEDRWRTGFPEWDRYGAGHPRVFDYPYQLGRWFDPYRQNVHQGRLPDLRAAHLLHLHRHEQHAVRGPHDPRRRRRRSRAPPARWRRSSSSGPASSCSPT